MRTGQLSWRLHFVTKASFNLVDRLARYGFSYVRLAYCSAGLVLVAAMIGVSAVAAGALVPDRTGDAYKMTMPSKPAQIVGIEDNSKAACLFNSPPLQKPQTNPTEKPGCEKFASISYGLDVVVPGINLAEVDRWQFKESETTPRFFGLFRYQIVFVFLHLLGLVMFGLFLLGITSWITTLLSRFDD